MRDGHDVRERGTPGHRSVVIGRAAVATLIDTRGATPKRAGARMWVSEAGEVMGSVTIGGCVDARVIETAGHVIARGEAVVLAQSLGDEEAWELGLTCGGAVRVLIEPVAVGGTDAGSGGAPREQVSARVVTATRLDDPRQRLVVVEGGETRGGFADEVLDAAVRREAARVLRDGVRSHVTTLAAGGETVEVFLDLLAPPSTLLVVGATHVAMALVAMGATLGLRTVVVDGRDRFATRERFPAADELLVGMPSELVTPYLAPTTALVLVAHDYKYELPVLESALMHPLRYVGVLGSRRRGTALLALLAERGVPPERLAPVRVPAGLDIGAESAEEIALSILAQIVAESRTRPGRPAAPGGRP